jgi:hypothetical protein
LHIAIGLVVVLRVSAVIADMGEELRNCHDVARNAKLAPRPHLNGLYIVDRSKPHLPTSDDSGRGTYRLHAVDRYLSGGRGLSLYVFGSQTRVR